jgi:UDP-2-acetamido-3-amino-2,3-dideoxy-glucuronate N-acetyltransferase
MTNVFIHPSAEIHPSAKIGEGTKIWNNVQIREDVEIGCNCNIGKGAYIDNMVKIGNHVKIQNFVSVYAGVEIEDRVFIGPNVSFTNDKYPRSFISDWEMFITKLKYGCSIGANATIICGVVIGAFSIVGAGSVVTTNILPYSLTVGNPARLINFVCENGHPLKQISFEEPIKYNCEICNKTLSLDFMMI